MLRTNLAAAGACPAGKVIHIFNGFLNPYGGSELEALSLYTLLCSQADVQLWATSSRVSTALMKAFPIRRVALHKGVFPKGGTFVFVGAHWRNKLWPYLIPKPNRLIYVYNTFHSKIIAITTKMPHLLAWPAPEFVLISEFQKRLLNMAGEVHPSPIDIESFSQQKHIAGGRPIVGRLSRSTPDKHHPDDIALYIALAQQGCEIRIQGGTCLREQLPISEHIHLFEEGHLPAPDFLQGLDIFYYRTGIHVETFGRVVFEAMACGLPVVCHSHGGYADAIRHGENGFVFDTTEQAQTILALLIANPALRATVGANARKTVEAMYAETAMQERLRFYLE
jgi:glycosyltransferase involved in cell wall biosynthesis